MSAKFDHKNISENLNTYTPLEFIRFAIFVSKYISLSLITLATTIDRNWLQLSLGGYCHGSFDLNAKILFIDSKSEVYLLSGHDDFWGFDTNFWHFDNLRLFYFNLDFPSG